LQTQIAVANTNSFVETCALDMLPYIADVVGYRPISALAPKGTDQPPAGGLAPTFRRDVGKTIWARRRKGTLAGLAGAVRAIAGWHAVIFENGRCIVSTPSLRYPGVLAAQGTPDMRKLLGPARIDQGPGLIPRVATVQRVAVARPDPDDDKLNTGRGRWHPLDVVVEVWNREACRQLHRTGTYNDQRRLTFDPDGNEIRLYAPADGSAEAGEILESARAVRLSDFAGRGRRTLMKAVYGPERSICLFTEPKGKLEAVTRSTVRFGPTGGPPHQKQWIIDPERGLIKPPLGHEGTVVCCYFRHHRLYALDDEHLINRVVKTRVGEHVPMEARAGIAPKY